MKERSLEIRFPNDQDVSDYLKDAIADFGYVVEEKNVDGIKILEEDKKASRLRYKRVLVGGRVVAKIYLPHVS